MAFLNPLTQPLKVLALIVHAVLDDMYEVAFFDWQTSSHAKSRNGKVQGVWERLFVRWHFESSCIKPLNVLALVCVHSTWYELALFTCFESILLCIDVIHKSASSISKPFCLRVSFTSSHVLRTYSWETLHCVFQTLEIGRWEKSNMWLWLKNCFDSTRS